MITPMTLAAADWIYAEVLPRAYRSNTPGQVPHDLRHCRCQGSTCGWCMSPPWRHERCTTRTHGPVVGCETYLLNQGGHHPASGYVPVWLSGTPCAWRCPCGCAVTKTPEVVAEPEPAVVQLELFALAGGAS